MMRRTMGSQQQQYLILAHNVNLKTIKKLYVKSSANPNFKTVNDTRRAINFQMRLHTYINEAFGNRIDIRMKLDTELEKLSGIASRLEELEEYARSSADMTEVFYQEQQQRLKDKFNNLILIVGVGGIGKTMLARNIGQRMDKTFRFNEDTFFLGVDFLGKIQAPKGKYLVFDEPKGELEARRGMEKGRPEINLVFTVFRIRQINVLLATIFPEDVDVADRKLVWSLLQVVDRGVALWYQPPRHGADPRDYSNWTLRGRVYFDNLDDVEWTKYEERKNEFIDTVVKRAEVKIAERVGKPAIDRKKVIGELVKKCAEWFKENKIKKPVYKHIHGYLLMEASDEERGLFKDPKDENALLDRILRGEESGQKKTQALKKGGTK